MILHREQEQDRQQEPGYQILRITENAFDPPIAQSAMDHRVVEIVGISDGYI